MTSASRLGLSNARSRRLSFLLALCLCLVGSGCGGGSQSSSPSPPAAAPDFFLTLNPTSVSISAGAWATTLLLATPANGFSSPISVQLSGLPSGVSISPSSITLTPKTPEYLSLSAQSDMAATTATITFTGTSGTLTHAVELGVTITASSGGGSGSGSLTTRTTYVRSDAVTEYFLWPNSHWTIYNQPTSRFFVTDPFSNTVFVYDSATEKEIATITVPAAYGIDETADGSTIYVGTTVGDVYTLDPVAMKVTHRFVASQIGPYGYGAWMALPLSNGSLALLGRPSLPPSVNGWSNFAIWNPTTNSIQIYGNLFSNPTAPTTPICGNANATPIFGLSLTADRSSILVGDGPSTICEMNASTGQYVTADTNAGADMAVSPDGNYLAFYDGDILLFDQKTLTEVAQFNVPGTDSGDMNLAFSADSKTLFVSSETIVYAYSVATHQQIGWFPNIFVARSSGGSSVAPSNNPIYQMEDGTGLLVGPMEEGLGFLDTTQMGTGPIGTTFLNAFLSPNTGPVTGGSVTEWPMSSTTVGNPTGVFFGKNPATSFSVTSTDNISATTPAGNPGPVNVFFFMSDGGMQLVADGFSYGPTILQVTPNMAAGGGASVVYGYGLGQTNVSTIPAGLSVSVNGVPATITGYNPDAYEGLPHPYPLEAIYFTIPPGATTADVTVTTPSGSVTAKGAITYLAAPKQYPLPGASLAQGIYDPYAGVYYFTDTNKIQVFSLAQQQWLTPIPIPAPAAATQRLWGISLSPDGSQLAVADIQANVIYLLDPSSPSSVKTFPFAPTLPSGFIAHPAGVAVTDSGVVYITAFIEGGSGYSSFYKLDTSSNTLTDYPVDNPGIGIDGVPQDPYLRTELSSDGSRVYFNDDGYVFSVNTATNAILHASDDPNCCYGNYGLALAPNQTQFEASNYLYDSNLNAQSFLTLNDRESKDITYVYGAKFSPDGSFFFQPSTSGIDVFDGRLGVLLDRIALPFTISSTYDALVSDGTDDVLLAILGGGNGIAVLNLNSLPAPPPLSYAAAPSRRWPSVARRYRLAGSASRTRVRRGFHPSQLPFREIPHAVRRIPLYPEMNGVLRPRSIPRR